MKISRRSFLLSGAAIATVVIVGYAVMGPALRKAEQLIADIVKFHLPFKNIEEADLQAFARDFDQKYQGDRTKLALLLLAAPVIFSNGLRRSLPGNVRYALGHYERRVLTQFILSTNFFELEDVNGPEIEYYGFYDPSQPCGFPLVET